MNGKKAKQLRRRSKELLIEWLRTMVPEGEDTSKITINNLDEFLPQQTHIFANNKLMLSAFVFFSKSLFKLRFVAFFGASKSYNTCMICPLIITYLLCAL